MKKTFLSLIPILICCNFLSAQKIALLNTDLKSPILYTDSVTVEQVSKNLFPVDVSNFDTLYANLDYLNEMLKIRQRSKMQSFELHSGSTIIFIKRLPRSEGDAYIMKATSTIGQVNSNFFISDTKRNNKRNSQRIEKIMAYMKTNKSFFMKPYAIHPRIYNVVVYTE